MNKTLTLINPLGKHGANAPEANMNGYVISDFRNEFWLYENGVLLDRFDCFEHAAEKVIGMGGQSIRFRGKVNGQEFPLLTTARIKARKHGNPET